MYGAAEDAAEGVAVVNYKCSRRGHCQQIGRLSPAADGDVNSC